MKSSFLPNAALCFALLAPLDVRAQNGQPSQTYTRGVQADIYAFAVGSDSFVTGGTRGTRTDANGNTADVSSLNRYPFSTGAPDPQFNAHPDGAVYALARYADGRLLVAGDFQQIRFGATVTNAPCIARLNPDGTLDPAFQADIVNFGGADPKITALALQADGKIVIGGVFDRVNGVVRGGIARLDPTGRLDSGFAGGAGANINGGEVNVLALQGGNVLVGGSFTGFNGQTRPALLRLSQTGGAFDSSFDAKFDAGSTVLTTLVDAAGAVFVGGSKLAQGGQSLGALAHLDPNGALDAAYQAAVMPTPVNGAPDPRFAQNPPAVPPPSFVAALFLQDDGRVLAGGLFDGVVSGVAYHNLVRLYPDGSLDPSFVLPANPQPAQQPELLAVDALATLPDGSLLVGTRVPPNYGRPIPGFPTDPVVNILINAIGLVGFKSPAYATAAGETQATISVKRSFGSVAGSLVYVTADGTAKAGRDYQAATGTMSWGSGDTGDRTFTVTIPPGSQGGTVQLALTNGSQGVTIYPTGAKATLTVAPVPAAPQTVSLKGQDDGATVEGGKRLQVRFKRTGADLGKALVVSYLVKGNAVSGVDYKPLSGQITIPAGEKKAFLKVKQIDNLTQDGTRTVNIKLQPDPNGLYTVGDPKKAIISISDND